MRNIDKIRACGKLILSTDEISSVTELPQPSVNVYCARATKRKELLRIKRGYYALPERVRSAGTEALFEAANRLISPSYISLLTALSYHGISSQVPSEVYESVTHTKSATLDVEDIQFRYLRLPEKYWFGFEKIKNFFMAKPEKALCEAVYLMSMGRYALDVQAINMKKIDIAILSKYLKRFPKKAQKSFDERFNV